MKTIITLSLACLFTLACNTATKENKTESKTTDAGNSEPIKKTIQAGSDNTIEFYLNGDENHVVKKADVSLDEIKGKQMLNISTSSMGEATATNLLVIDVKDIAPGTYSFDEEGKYGAPTASFMPVVADVTNTYKFNMGSITIISNDGNVINGTFEGAAKNKKGDLFSISKGKIINAKIHKRITSN